jgi:ferredoxin
MLGFGLILGIFQLMYPGNFRLTLTRNPAPAAQLAAEATTFALTHEAGGVGIAPMDPLYIFKGYSIDDPWVIVLALAPDYEKLKEVPSDETNGVGVTAIGEQYARGTRASYALANWIRAQGYSATAYPGPSASALLLVPPAIASGLGELGKHGSLINRQFGAGLRLAGVTTDMPLVATAPDRFGADEFCASCQVCTRACPPAAISESKQLVRGVERWYVDFDKCIPYFAEAASCGICIAECPWTRPDARPKLLDTMDRRNLVGVRPLPAPKILHPKWPLQTERLLSLVAVLVPVGSLKIGCDYSIAYAYLRKTLDSV